MLTVGELQYWLNKYLAQDGLSPDAIVYVSLDSGQPEDEYEESPAMMISCHVKNKIATLHAATVERYEEIMNESDDT